MFKNIALLSRFISNSLKDMSFDIFLTPNDLSELMGITVQALYKQLKDLDIETAKVGSRRRIYPHHMREYIRRKGLSIPRMVVSFSIVKGGVGKTTFAHALGIRSSAYGLKTLIIDLDQQANLTSSFGIDPKLTLMDVAENKKTAREVVVPVTDFLHILPSNLQLANLDLFMGNAVGKHPLNFLKNWIGDLRDDYDIVFIDCPPSLSRPIVAAHGFSDKIVMPILVDKFSMDGIRLAVKHLQSLQEDFDISPEVLIAMNRYDGRHKRLEVEIVQKLLFEDYRDFLLNSFIGVSKEIDNLIVSGKTIWDGKKSQMAVLQDFDRLTIELLGLSSWARRQGGQSSPPLQELALV